jgi:hypothetical protein
VEEAKENFKQWAPEMLRAIHDRGYQPPPILRVFIPKPGKKEKRPLGIPCVTDRALQRSVAAVLSAIYEQDFLPCSFGGRPGLGAHLLGHGELTRARSRKRSIQPKQTYRHDASPLLGGANAQLLLSTKPLDPSRLRFRTIRIPDPPMRPIVRATSRHQRREPDLRLGTWLETDVLLIVLSFNVFTELQDL